MKDMHGPRVEIAVQDVAGARTALEAGADRIEVCAGLGAYGGLTPSWAVIAGCSRVGLPLGAQVLIRPRAGAFVYENEDERRVQVEDVRSAVRAGAGGVVVGALNVDGRVDLALCRDLVTAARSAGDQEGRRVEVTFHRAFDMVVDRSRALDQLIDLGFDRVLTSGGAPSVPEGMDSIGDLVSQAAGRIQIMAGGGVRIDAIGEVLDLGVAAVHLSAKRLVPAPAGPGGGGEDASAEVTDAGTVAAAVRAVRAYRSRRTAC